MRACLTTPRCSLRRVAGRPGRQHPAGPAEPGDRGPRAAGAGQGRVPEPRRLGEGPDRAADGRGRRGRRPAASPAARSWSRPAATPASGWPWWPSARATAASSSARTRSSQDKRDVLRAYGAEVVVCPTAVAAGAPGLLLLGLRPAGRGDPRRLEARPVLQPGGPGQPLRDHRTGDLGRHRRPGHPLRRRGRHRRHHLRHRPLPQGGVRGPAAGRPVQIIGADPEGSVYSGGTGRPYLVEGVGEDFWPRPTTRPCRTRSSRSATPTRSR